VVFDPPAQLRRGFATEEAQAPQLNKHQLHRLLRPADQHNVALQPAAAGENQTTFRKCS
jgi:hypothetical protein